MISDDFDSCFVVSKSEFWLTLLEHLSQFKVSIKVHWIQFNDLFEIFERLLLIDWILGLTSLDLCQQSNSFIAVFVLLISKYGIQVHLSSLIVPQVEENFSQAELSLDILWIVSQTLLVVLECLVKALLHMVYLTQNEVEVTP
jgi:hypothetical protein